MGRTALALLALTAVLFSLFSIAGPALGAHEVAGHAGTRTVINKQNPGGFEFDGNNPNCPSGTTELKKEPTPNGTHTTASVQLTGQTGLTSVTFTVSGNTVTTFTVTNGLAAYVFVKATNDTAVFNYTGQPGGGIAHDDTLISPATDSISHVSFCVIAAPLTPDVTVAKDTSVTTVAANGTFNYVFIVTTSGNGPSANVQLSDPLPSAFTYGTPVITGGDAGDTCSTAGDALSCSLGTVASGTSITVTLQATTDAADCGDPITNTATVSSTVNTNANNNTDTASITVTCAPDVTVAKATSVTTVAANGAFNYVFTVTTGGTGSSVNVTLTDPLPDDFTYGTPAITSPDDDDTCSITEAGTLSCSFGTEPSGTTITVTLQATTDAADCGDPITNTATVGATGDSNTSNNTDGASITVTCAPDVTVAKSTSADPVAAGSSFNYVFAVTTSGTGSSANVTLSDPLPDNFTYGTPVITGGDQGDTCSTAGGQLSCSFGTVPSGTTITVTLQATTDATDCGPAITNTATVAATVNTNANNNTSTADVTVVCAPDVTVAKSTSADPVAAGSSFNYVFQVTAGGTGPSLNVTLSDPLPDAFTYGTPVITGGDAGDTCSTAGGALSCQFGTVASGTTITVTLPATTDAADCGPAITNTATVASTVNTITNNNTASADVTVQCAVQQAPTLVIDKSANTETITITGAAGALVASPSTVTWTLTYTLANGPVHGAVITDPVPAGFTFLDATGGGTLVGNTVTWNLGTLTSSGSVTFRTTVDPVNVPRGVTTNTATIDSTETAPDTGQDTVTVTQTGTLGSNPTPSPTPTVRQGTQSSTGVPNTSTSADPGLTVVATIGALVALAAAVLLSANATRERRRR